MAAKNGVVNIHGKEYKTVALRVSELREAHGLDIGIHTELVSSGDNVIVKASVVDKDGRVIGTGYAEEVRGSTNINKTSAVENCETSAVGRALSAAGFGGQEYASANEVTDAILQQAVMDAVQPLIECNQALRDNFDSIVAIKEAVKLDDPMMAVEAWQELSEATKRALWIAPTKGGVFTTAERDYLKTAQSRAKEQE